MEIQLGAATVRLLRDARKTRQREIFPQAVTGGQATRPSLSSSSLADCFPLPYIINHPFIILFFPLLFYTFQFPPFPRPPLTAPFMHLFFLLCRFPFFLLLFRVRVTFSPSLFLAPLPFESQCLLVTSPVFLMFPPYLPLSFLPDAFTPLSTPLSPSASFCLPKVGFKVRQDPGSSCLFTLRSKMTFTYTRL